MPPPKDPIKYEEWRRKKSEAMKGKNTQPKSEETKEKLRIAITGKKHTELTKRKMSESRMGMIHSGSFKKGEKRRLGIHHTPESNQKNREKHLGLYDGEKNPFYGRTHSDETKQKISTAQEGKYKGCNNPMYGVRRENAPGWKGGISFEPYCPLFNKEFRERVRSFFGRKCVECGMTEEENGWKLAVHHVNYNKKSCCQENEPVLDRYFVPLCKHCHGKTLSKKLEKYYKEHFEDLINNKYNGKCYYTQEEYIQLQLQQQ